MVSYAQTHSGLTHVKELEMTQVVAQVYACVSPGRRKMLFVNQELHFIMPHTTLFILTIRDASKQQNNPISVFLDVPKIIWQRYHGSAGRMSLH